MDINQSNFRQTRRSYGITLQDVADKCHLSASSIMNYEQYTGQYTQVRTRDDNAKRIVRALDELITEKIEETFPFGSKIAKKEGDNIKTDSNYNLQTGYNKAKVSEIVKKHCKCIDFTLTEFCKLCNISPSTISPFSIVKSPVMRESVVNKICEATGLDKSIFDDAKLTQNNCSNDCISKESDSLMHSQPIDGSKVVETSEKLDTSSQSLDIEKTDLPYELMHSTGTTVKTTDKRYVCENGVYYEEYTVIKHVKHLLSKEQFMQAVKSEN